MLFFMKIFLLLAITSIKDLNAQDDGDVNILVVGGEEIPITKAPYQAALLVNNQLFCGGTIIAQKWILTAAHCTPGLSVNTLRVRVGSADYQSGGQLLQATQIIVHPKYNTTTHDQDAALIALKTKVQAGTIISITSSEPAAGTDVLTSGWGSQQSGGAVSNKLRQVEIDIVARSTCKTAYGPNAITNRMICAGRPGKDTCQGDSGGPLNTAKSLVGIVSWGVGCALPKYPGVYTNIADASITNFIKKYVK